MFITRIGDQRCCTCNHWQGVRVTENDGFIYSLKDVEGICHNLGSVGKGQLTCMSLTFPSATCHGWQEWNGLSEQGAQKPDGKIHPAATAAGML